MLLKETSLTRGLLRIHSQNHTYITGGVQYEHYENRFHSAFSAPTDSYHYNNLRLRCCFIVSSRRNTFRIEAVCVQRAEIQV